VVLVALLEADWSAEGVVLAEAEGVVLDAPADWSAEAAPAAGVVVVVVVVWVLCELSVVDAAGAVEEAAGAAEELADCWFASGAACIAPPEPEAVESVVAVGCAPLGAAALSFAEGTGALLLFKPESVTGAVEFGLEGRLSLLAEAAGAAAAEGAAEAPALLQESEIIFASATLNLLSEPIEPVNEA